LVINAEDVSGKLNDGYILVDAQKATSYSKEHIESAVNIERNDIMIKIPVPNTLATAEIVAEVAGKVGLTENSNIVIYDDNQNMDSSRLFWTLKIWGHKGDILIVSGGLQSLKKAGFTVTVDIPQVKAATYETGPLQDDMIATKEDLLAMIDNPDENFVLIDVRTDEEYNAGTIPGSIHINHEKNLFINDEKGTTFRPYSHNRILYKELGITPESEIVLYCKSSVRAANSYVALYDAGYRNLKIYDGAWLEWATEKLPVFKPEVTIQASTVPASNS
jgi:thiosulfate/3-mercaptopyruvate sulfurtransferase